jgi:hypothetical protein
MSAIAYLIGCFRPCRRCHGPEDNERSEGFTKVLEDEDPEFNVPGEECGQQIALLLRPCDELRFLSRSAGNRRRRAGCAAVLQTEGFAPTTRMSTH